MPCTYEATIFSREEEATRTINSAIKDGKCAEDILGQEPLSGRLCDIVRRSTEDIRDRPASSTGNKADEIAKQVMGKQQEGAPSDDIERDADDGETQQVEDSTWSAAIGMGTTLLSVWKLTHCGLELRTSLLGGGRAPELLGNGG